MHDRVYIVTGGGGAIARPILETFSAAGSVVVAADVRTTTLPAAVTSAGGFPLEADLATPVGAERLIREVLDRCGRIDGLVHTVGGFAMGRVHEVDPSQYDKVFDLNVRTLFHATRAVLPHFLDRGDGFLAAFSSMHARTGSAPGKALYGAAKSAVASFLHSIDEEVAGTGILVSVVYPMGSVDTPANRRDMPAEDPATWIDPVQIAQALHFAATRSPRGRVLDLAIHPPRAAR
jgi:NAD(P)-dependent dehydrogenase (short-subunit alcohol dehydrogenase family)